MGRSKVHIGTSGWHYLHWKGPYYPENLSPKYFLDHYAQDFHTVEINSTFYKLPEISTLKTWKESVPQDFLFSVKMSRYITHTKRLKDPKSSLQKFFSRIKYLQEKLAVILIQLPPNWSLNLERFKAFLQALPKGYRYAFEFRDESWFCEEIFSLLKKYGCALCIYELGKKKTEKILTADFVYIRLHGPKKAYQGSYSPQVLSNWAKSFEEWKKKRKEIFCYFDNDEKGYAPQNARLLQKKMMARK